MNVDQKIRNAMADSVRIGRVSQINNSEKIQTVNVDVRVGVIDTNVPRFQNYGFSSHPDGGDDLLAVEVTVNGHRFVIALDDLSNRPKTGEAGDVWMYHREGHFIQMGKEEVINTKCKTMNMEFETLNMTGDVVHNGNTTQTGDTTQTGKITASDDVVAAGVSLKNHPQFAPDNTTPMTGKPIPTL